jgi:2-oxoglutarate ferredoxin oxidoreductase subunit alpha
MAKVLMKGNEAIAELRFRQAAGFSLDTLITPQNQIPEYMARRLPEVGGTFLQAESRWRR